MSNAALIEQRQKAGQGKATTSEMPYFSVKSFGMSHPGRVRESNEDRFAIAELARALHVHHSNLPPSKMALSFDRAHVYLVADGVGGSSAGEVASGMSVATIENFVVNTLKRFSNLQANEEQGVLRSLQEALSRADARIFEESAKHPEWRGMGTTLTMAFAVNWKLFVAHAGDSRCYLFSGGKLLQLTQDHTLTAEMVRRGMVRNEDVETHPWRHVVTNILGGSERGVQAELHLLDLHPGDVLLLCSDGLTEMVPDLRILEILQRSHEPRQTCERLIVEANERGGKDNITAIVVHLQE
jgi:serine/threonine protein phosphatase PrpC